MTSNAREINQFQLIAKTKMLSPCLVLDSKQFRVKFDFFYLKLFFYVFRLFWCADIKNNFKIIIIKYYFNTFPSEKLFEKQPLPHFQTLWTYYRKLNYNNL